MSTARAAVNDALPPPTSTRLIECSEVARTYRSGTAAVVAVRAVSCSVGPGDRIAIMGPSGSGKSTLLHLMAGLDQPTTGTIRWPALQDVPHRSTAIGVVFQGPSLIPSLTAAENAALPLLLAGVAESEAITRATEAMAVLDIDDLANKLPEELSGGQAQRVAVARVLASAPSVILADEPTGQLDHEAGGRLISALLTAAHRSGAALAVATHDPAVAERFDMRWQMNDGLLGTTRRSPAGDPTDSDIAR